MSKALLERYIRPWDDIIPVLVGRRQLRSPHFTCVAPFYLVSVLKEIKDHTHEVNVNLLLTPSLMGHCRTRSV